MSIIFGFRKDHMRQLVLSILSIVSLLFLFGTSGCASVPVLHPILPGPQQAVLVADETVALISDFGPEDHHGAFCSGVWVGHKTILTAAHCVTGYADMKHKIAIIHALVADGCPEDLAITLVKMGVVDEEPDDDATPMQKRVWEIAQSVPKIPEAGLDLPYIVQEEVVDIGASPKGIHHTKATVINHKFDLALLEVQGPVPFEHHAVASLADETPPVGAKVSVVGHNHGNFYLFRTGEVAAYRHSMKHDDVEIEGPFMQTSAPVGFGDSGGGVFDDRGQLVGINSFINTTITGGFAIHLRNIRSFLAGQHLVAITLDPSQKDPALDD